jgi:hypothetical protein
MDPEKLAFLVGYHHGLLVLEGISLLIDTSGLRQ